MLRPNLAQDAPPAELTVGGVQYAIDVDFRTWIDILRDLRDLISTPETPQHAAHNAEIIVRVEKAAFGRLIEQPVPDVLAAITDFASGYPEAPVGEGRAPAAQTYSFDYDINHIILAIRVQYGVDLSWRRKEPFHFWEFLAMFRSLCGDHYILRLMEIRGYDGKDTELKQQALRYALPRETTADDQAMLDEFDALFYNA